VLLYQMKDASGGWQACNFLYGTGLCKGQVQQDVPAVFCKY